MADPTKANHPDVIQGILLGSPVARHLGIRLDRADRNGAVLTLPFSPAITTVADMVHGGVIATLIDIAGAAAFLAGADPDMDRGATTALTLNFLEAARSVDLEATATVLRRGRVQTVCEVEVRDPANRLVAKGVVASQGRTPATTVR